MDSIGNRSADYEGAGYGSEYSDGDVEDHDPRQPAYYQSIRTPVRAMTDRDGLPSQQRQASASSVTTPVTIVRGRVNSRRTNPLTGSEPRHESPNLGVPPLTARMSYVHGDTDDEDYDDAFEHTQDIRRPRSVAQRGRRQTVRPTNPSERNVSGGTVMSATSPVSSPQQMRANQLESRGVIRNADGVSLSDESHGAAQNDRDVSLSDDSRTAIQTASFEDDNSPFDDIPLQDLSARRNGNANLIMRMPGYRNLAAEANREPATSCGGVVAEASQLPRSNSLEITAVEATKQPHAGASANVRGKMPEIVVVPKEPERYGAYGQKVKTRAKAGGKKMDLTEAMFRAMFGKSSVS